MKDDGPINHVGMIYSFTIKSNTKEISYTLIDSMMMETRMKDYATDIIEVKTTHIFINSKRTSTIGVAKPNLLVHHLRDILISYQRKLRTKIRRSKVLKFEKGDGKRRFLNIMKR